MPGKKAVLFLLLCLALATVVVGCRKTTYPFIGAWVSQDSPTPYKYVYKADGMVEGYLTEDMKAPGLVARFVVEKTNTDANGDTLFHVKERWCGLPFKDEAATTWYTLIKVRHDGNSFEHDASQVAYPPDDFSRGPLGSGFHHIYVLKE
jgi:hypothetical protein